MGVNPQQFSEPGGGVDFRIGADDSGPPNNWRVNTPPAGEDGTVPDVRLTLAHEIYPNIPAEGGGVLVTTKNPSTFDLPIG